LNFLEQFKKNKEGLDKKSNSSLEL
jgi:hypothetical protein